MPTTPVAHELPRTPAKPPDIEAPRTRTGLEAAGKLVFDTLVQAKSFIRRNAQDWEQALSVIQDQQQRRDIAQEMETADVQIHADIQGLEDFEFARERQTSEQQEIDKDPQKKGQKPETVADVSTGNFRVKLKVIRGTQEFATGNVIDHYRGGIWALKKAITETAGKTDDTSNKINQSALVLKEIRPNVQVLVTDNQGQTQEISLQEWESQITNQALILWRQLTNNPAGTEEQFHEEVSKSPLFKYTLERQAEEKLTDKKTIKYQLVYARESKLDGENSQLPEAGQIEEAEKKVENAFIDWWLDRVGSPKVKTKDGKEIEIIEYEIGEDGNVVIDQETGRPKIKQFHPERLRDVPIDENLVSMTTLMGAYFDKNTPPEARENLIALVYTKLKTFVPERVKDIPHAQIFAERVGRVPVAFKKWLTDIGYRGNVESLNLSNDEIIRILSISYGFEKGKIDLHNLSKETKAFWQNLEPEWQNIISTFLSREGTTGLFLEKFYGLNPDFLLDPNKKIAYADQVLNVVTEEKKLTPVEQNTYRQIIYYHFRGFNEDHFEKLAKERGFPKGLGYGLMLLLIFAPSIQGLLGIGLGGEEEKQG